MKLRWIFFIITIAVFPSILSSNEFYKCSENGQTIFTDKPCNNSEIDNKKVKTESKIAPNILLFGKKELEQFASYLQKKYSCPSNKHSARNSIDLVCVERARYWDYIGQIELWIIVGAENISVQNAINTSIPREYYKYLEQLYNSFENKWGIYKSRLSWTSGLLQREVSHFFAKSEDIKYIVNSITSCAVLGVKTYTEKGIIYLVRTRNGNIKLASITNDMKQHKKTFESFDQNIQEENKPGRVTKCLNPAETQETDFNL